MLKIVAFHEPHFDQADMKLHQLRVFESVARHLNVTSAADELCMSQPAASLQLKRLEDEYQAQFFERTNRGMELTERGQAFLDAIRPIINELDRIDVEFKTHVAKTEAGILKLGAAHTLSFIDVPELLIEFKKLRPNVQVDLETGSSEAIEALVHSLKLDIALIMAPNYLPSCVYEVYEEYERESVAFVAPHHQLAGRTIEVEELVKNSLVIRNGSACVMELQRRGFVLRFAMQCHAPDAVKVAVRGGLGVGLLSRSWVRSDLEKGDLKVVNISGLKSMTFKSFMVFDKRRPLSPCAQDFVRTLRKIKSTFRPDVQPVL